MITNPKYVNEVGDLEIVVDGSPLLISPLREDQRDFPVAPDLWHLDPDGFILDTDGTRKQIGGEERRAADLPDGVLRLHALPATVKLIYAAAQAGVYGEIEAYAPPPPPLLVGPDVNAERDRRIARFTHGGLVFQMDESSQQLIIAAGADAKFAIAAGAQEGDLRWADPDQDFAWWDASNVRHAMDAHDMSAFADAAKRWVADHRRIARDIKDDIAAGGETAPQTMAELQADSRWPA